MGIAKNYLRYVHESTFGVVAASQVGASIKFLRMQNTEDRFLAVPANENVFFWNLKTKQITNQLEYDSDNAAEVTVIDCYHGGHPRTNLIAVGYANGHIRVFEYETGILKLTFTGHRTAISALAFDKDGSRLASGGKDCNIVLWDIVGEKGMFSLKGHKNSITKLAFLFNEEYQKDIIVSSSVDAVATIKFWDVQLQHCFYTIPGQTSGVWSFALLKNGTRLVAGSTSPELKVYSIEFLSESEKLEVAKDDRIDEIQPNEDLENNSSASYGIRVKHIGNILRNSYTVSNRVQDIVLDSSESVMICHSIDKSIEIYGIRSPEEALLYAKKQAKKAARKQAKRKKMAGDDDEEEDTSMMQVTPVTSMNSLSPQSLVDCEFNRKYGSRKLSDKVKALAIARTTGKKSVKCFRIAVISSSNKIDSFMFAPSVEDSDEQFQTTMSIYNQSHRTDVRAVAISSDNTHIMSASAEAVKIWRLDSRLCTTTIETEYAICCTFAETHIDKSNTKNRYALLGTKEGNIQIIDIAEARVTQTIKVSDDDKPVTSIFVLPDMNGIACGSEDGQVRLYKYAVQTTVENEKEQTTLTLENDRNFPFQEGVTCVNVSPDSKLLAVALLDSTVRVHFMDTFKFFLNMYGHKFPVTTMDISDDNTLLVTGSPDKNIKIWGLDFGDCHRSIFAHEDAITCVRFLPRTHYIFSCGRDKAIKQWDCDRFIKIQTLRKHQAEIWCLAISPNGKYLVTGSHDKSLRLYRKTEEILVPEDEDETERELQDERNVWEKQENIIVGEISLETGFATKMTIDTVRSTDTLIEAIDVFGSEQEKEREYKKLCENAEREGLPLPVEPEHDPLLMTAMTTDYNRYMLEILRRMKSSELEEILITLPFDYVRKLLIILVIFLEKLWDVELMIRCATFLLKVNFGQIAASPALVPVINKLKAVVSDRASSLRNCAGFNMLALEHLNQNRKYLSTRVSRE